MKNINFILSAFFLLAVMAWACKKTPSEQQKITEPIVINPYIEVVKETKVEATFSIVGDADVPPSFADSAKKAQDLLTMVFSSKDFRDELYKRNFHDSAYSKTKSTCFNKVYGGTIAGRSIAGKSVYNNLLYQSSLDLKINIKYNGTNTTTMGSSSACGSVITTNDYWLKLTEKKLAYRLARHWAHEYTHIRGYRHGTAVAAPYTWSSNDVNLDPAAGVGDIVGLVLDKWIALKIIKY